MRASLCLVTWLLFIQQIFIHSVMLLHCIIPLFLLGTLVCCLNPHSALLVLTFFFYFMSLWYSINLWNKAVPILTRSLLLILFMHRCITNWVKNIKRKEDKYNDVKLALIKSLSSCLYATSSWQEEKIQERSLTGIRWNLRWVFYSAVE